MIPSTTVATDPRTIGTRSNRQSTNSKRRGFMLLTVVVTLAIVCLLFYQLAQLSLSYVQRTAERERTTRERWTVVSLRRAALQQTPAVLSLREQSLNAASTTASSVSLQNAIYLNEIEDQIKLNNAQVTIHAQDESARVFVPGLLRAKPRAEVKTMIERLQGSRGLIVKDLPPAEQSVSIKAWRDVFQWSPDGTSQLEKATQRMTLWGSGKINIYRAEDQTLEELWRALFGHFPPREIMDARNSFPPLPWQNIRERLDLRDAQAALAEAWFGTTSTCYSIRLTIANSKNASKRYYFVEDRGSNHFGFEE